MYVPNIRMVQSSREGEIESLCFGIFSLMDSGKQQGAFHRSSGAAGETKEKKTWHREK
jgi:hypothetical protein